MFGVRRILEGFREGMALELELEMWSGKKIESFIPWWHNNSSKVLVVGGKHGQSRRGWERRSRQGGLAEPQCVPA